jgi:hypothetical protein
VKSCVCVCVSESVCVCVCVYVFVFPVTFKKVEERMIDCVEKREIVYTDRCFVMN